VAQVAVVVRLVPAILAFWDRVAGSQEDKWFADGQAEIFVVLWMRAD
jgi:hypothetical protein